ncbi:cupin domain-containing protein [Marinobacter sp. BSs20148]|jgi:transcriptional regulator with XRE-family HTH domain|uniref:cupin domain-containing protein n=1 Tax=Marinobacter sp. BSs20148 TaxID=490759 RepID=UPI000A005B73|nr:cupin domain-containing protein [Marinobacter sp. BSs20148]
MDREAEIARTGMDHRELGLRLKHLRMSRGMRMKDVAAGAGCSESMVSKIESGNTAPSLRVLHNIAHALDTSIAALFEPPRSESLVRRAGERPVIRLSSQDNPGQIALERLAPTQEGANLEANIHIIEPGAESDGTISHDGEELGYLIEGCLELEVDGDKFFLQTGDSFSFSSKCHHRYRNPGRIIARVLWVNTPPTF